MAFQSQSFFFTSPAIPGELVFIGAEPRTQPRIMFSGGVNPNTFGYVFTETTAGDIQLGNTATVGGTGVFAGILVQPKAANSNGTSVSTLAATLSLPDYSKGDMLSFGNVAVVLPNSSAIGDLVSYNTTTGAIADTFAATASFTASQATTVLTVTAITAGNIGVGTIIRSASGAKLGEVFALGTGTGGTGTYTLDTSATVSSTTLNGNSTISTAGTKLIPNARVNHYAVNAASVGIITLTN
jgi:hypothetical protein